MATHQNTNLLYALLKYLNVKHTKSFPSKLHEEHPHKDNLFGLSKMLSDYGIPSEGLRFEDKEDFSTIPLPFVAQFNGRLVIILRIKESRVDYYADGREKDASVEEFKEKWSGVSLCINPDNCAIEPEYKQNKRKEIYTNVLKITLLAAISLLVILIGISQNLFSDFGHLALLALNLSGVYVSYLLILKQSRFHGSIADKICSLFKSSNCNDVLESKASKLWGLIGWSDVGFGYFTSNVIIILLLPQLLPYLALINICVMPYSIWSIWYQKVKAKQWCPLCLIVQMLFYVIFTVTLIFGYIQIPTISLSNILTIGLVYLIPFTIVSLLVPVLIKSLKVTEILQAMNNLKMNDNVYTSLLESSNYYAIDPSVSRIVFGNPEAATQITVVSNPHCGPCGTAHEKLDHLLDQIGDEICVRIIFVNFEHEYTKDSGKFLIAAYLNNDKESAKEIFYKWFTEERYKLRQTYEKYGYDIETEEVLAEHQKHEDWQTENNVPFTPAILINGYELPRIYDISDLRLM